MYTHRTNLLLTKTAYRTLQKLSEKRSVTMANLIREAINDKYNIKEEKVETNAEIVANIKKLMEGVKTSDLDIKELINYGRRY